MMILRKILLMKILYISIIEIKDFNALINNKPFFGESVKRKQETYEKLIKIRTNYDYTTGKLLDF